jgi:hypothetical protein
MSHSRGHRSVALFNRSSLPAAAQEKSPQSLTINDLTTSQRQVAQGRDLIAIMDNGKTIILAPTGDFAGAVLGIRQEQGL